MGRGKEINEEKKNYGTGVNVTLCAGSGKVKRKTTAATAVTAVTVVAAVTAATAVS